jgi:hypothetical protein
VITNEIRIILIVKGRLFRNKIGDTPLLAFKFTFSNKFDLSVRLQINAPPIILGNVVKKSTKTLDAIFESTVIGGKPPPETTKFSLYSTKLQAKSTARKIISKTKVDTCKYFLLEKRKRKDKTNKITKEC